MLLDSLANRFTDPLTWITILVGLFLVWGLMFDKPKAHQEQASEKKSKAYSVDRFVVILVLLGLGLTLVPEFIYLLDQFGTRMNTIFKFYFQTWILWSIAAGYGTVMIWTKMKSGIGYLAKAASVIMLLVGLAYPVFAIWDTSHHFGITKNYDEERYFVNWEIYTLDGADYREWWATDEMIAINWLKEQPVGIVAEAVGGAYSDYARVSTYSGQPTVLGWANHESQWRGGYEEIGSREADIEMLYRSGLWNQTKEVLDKYQITYVFVGIYEIEKYNANSQVFEAHLSRLFSAGDVVVYGYTPEE